MLALRQYPQGGAGRARRSVIAGLIRNPEGRGAGANNTTPSRHCGLDP